MEEMHTPLLYAQYTYARGMSVACADGPAKKQVSCAACNLAVEVSYCYDIHVTIITAVTGVCVSKTCQYAPPPIIA
jgi:hypothetical protein